MIARVRLLLPTYIGMVLDDYEPFSVTKFSSPGSEFTVLPPTRVRHDLSNPFEAQPQTTIEEVFAGWNVINPEDVLTGHKMIDKDHWWANCFVVDCRRSAFEQNPEQSSIVLEAAELVNELLKKLRWRGQQSYIRP